MLTGATTIKRIGFETDGLRPVNLRTDLADLADLIELVFADTMDENGRAAIREMRYMSHLGLGLTVIGHLNEMLLGISKGFVWIEDGRLVGNVSIYPAHWNRDAGKAWMIANVGVHPDYRGRGIARQLMQASLQMIRNLGANHAILQVDYDNHPAIQLYESMDFVKERAFTVWARSALIAAPSLRNEKPFHITHPRPADWQAEYQLAQLVRPNERGGLGWLKPLHTSMFRPGLLRQIQDLLSLNSRERLLIRSEDRSEVLAEVWIEHGFTLTRTRLIMLAKPGHLLTEGEAILHTVLRRFQTSGFILEHPHDDLEASEMFQRLRFIAMRTVWHMRFDL